MRCYKLRIKRELKTHNSDEKNKKKGQNCEIKIYNFEINVLDLNCIMLYSTAEKKTELQDVNSEFHVYILQF